MRDGGQVENHIEPRVTAIESTLKGVVPAVQSLQAATAKHDIDIALIHADLKTLKGTMQDVLDSQRGIAQDVQMIRSHADQAEGFWTYTKRIVSIIALLLGILTAIIGLEHARLLVQNSENLIHWRSVSSANGAQFASGDSGSLSPDFEYSLNR